LFIKVLVQAEREVAALEVGIGIEALRDLDPSQGELSVVAVGPGLERGVAVGHGTRAQEGVLPGVVEGNAVVAAEEPASLDRINPLRFYRFG
jgi:hypothetical protein